MSQVEGKSAPSSQKQPGATAEAGVGGGIDEGGAVPMPPVFGNANAGAATDMDFKVRHGRG